MNLQEKSLDLVFLVRFCQTLSSIPFEDGIAMILSTGSSRCRYLQKWRWKGIARRVQHLSTSSVYATTMSPIRRPELTFSQGEAKFCINTQILPKRVDEKNQYWEIYRENYVRLS